MGLKKTNLSLLKCVTFCLVCVWVKSNWDNVTKYEVFFFEGVPYAYMGIMSLIQLLKRPFFSLQTLNLFLIPFFVILRSGPGQVKVKE